MTRPTRHDKAHKLGYKAKEGAAPFLGLPCAAARASAPPTEVWCYGKPKHQGINQTKFARNLQAVAEERVGKRAANLRVLNSYWVNQGPRHTSTLSARSHLCRPSHQVIRNDPRINWMRRDYMPASAAASRRRGRKSPPCARRATARTI